MIKRSQTGTRYSEAFKRQVVSEIETGRYCGPYAAARAYGIRGRETIVRWLRRYGDAALLPPRKFIVTTSKQAMDETKELKKRVRDLERALADACMKGLLNESYLEIACERLGVDAEAFKKKHVTRLSGGPVRKEGK